MATIRLGIHRDYVPTWGVWEAVRDLVQNGLDEDDKGYALSAKYWPNSSTLELMNTGSSLPDEALLIGFTTKADGKSRGQYGEGLKLAMLALVRNDIKVSIYSGGKSYTPAIEPDPAMNGAETLVIRTGKSKVADATRVLVTGLSETDWLTIRTRFTKWAGFADTVTTSAGTLIRDASAKGKVYVKGIWACDVKDLAYGYDLKNCGLDRDRNVPRQYELEYYTGMILSEATSKKSITPDVLVEAIKQGSPEARNLAEWNFPKQDVAAQILAEHPGVDAFAYSDDEAKQATPDMKVVVLPNRAKELLGSHLPTVQHVLQARRATPRAIYSESDLSSVEIANLSLFSTLVTGDPDSVLAADMDNVVSQVPRAGKNKYGEDQFTPVIRRRNLASLGALAEALVEAPSHMGAKSEEIIRELLDQRAQLKDDLLHARLGNEASEVLLSAARMKSREIEVEAVRAANEEAAKIISAAETIAASRGAYIVEQAIKKAAEEMQGRVFTHADIQAALQELL